MSAFDVRSGVVPISDIVGRLVRNPNYTGPRVELNGWHYTKSTSNHTKPGFQEALNRSVASEGVRNPILVWSLPEGIFLTFGGSRVKAAMAAGFEDIPAIINDYTGDFAACPHVTADNLADIFTDVPRTFEFGEYGFDYHYNLERARRHDHDPAGLAWTGTDAPFIQQEFPWLSEQSTD